jgi:hypothetical protein
MIQLSPKSCFSAELITIPKTGLTLLVKFHGYSGRFYYSVATSSDAVAIVKQLEILNS